MGTRCELSYQLTYSIARASMGATLQTQPYLRVIVSLQLELCRGWRCQRWALTSHNQHLRRSIHPLSMKHLGLAENEVSNAQSTASYSSSKLRRIHHYVRLPRIHSEHHPSAIDSAHSYFHQCLTCCCLVHFPRSVISLIGPHHAFLDIH